jgi:hypothetical protein
MTFARSMNIECHPRVEGDPGLLNPRPMGTRCRWAQSVAPMQEGPQSIEMNFRHPYCIHRARSG